MERFFGSLGILFVLSLLALLLTGCENPPWATGMTVSLKVESPRDGATVATSSVTVSGRVLGTQRATAKVKINDAAVAVKEEKFTTPVTLTEGKNVISIEATAGPAKASEKVTVTYAPAK